MTDQPETEFRLPTAAQRVVDAMRRADDYDRDGIGLLAAAGGAFGTAQELRTSVQSAVTMAQGFATRVVVPSQFVGQAAPAAAAPAQQAAPAAAAPAQQVNVDHTVSSRNFMAIGFAVLAGMVGFFLTFWFIGAIAGTAHGSSGLMDNNAFRAFVAIVIGVSVGLIVASLPVFRPRVVAVQEIHLHATEPAEPAPAQQQ